VKQRKSHEPVTHIDPGKLLRRKIVAERLGTSEEYVRLVNDPNSAYYIPTFPLPIRIGKNAVAYIEAEILDWIAQCERANKRSEG